MRQVLRIKSQSLKKKAEGDLSSLPGMFIFLRLLTPQLMEFSFRVNCCMAPLTWGIIILIFSITGITDIVNKLLSVSKPESQLWCCYLDWRRAPGDPGSVVWWCDRWARPVRCPGRWLTVAVLSASLPSFHPAPGPCSPPLTEEDGPLGGRRRRSLAEEETKEKESPQSIDLSVQVWWHFSSLWKEFIQKEIKNILRVNFSFW